MSNKWIEKELLNAAERANVDYEAVKYGMRVEGAWLLECFIVIVISTMLHLRLHCILFICMFSYLRIYCGGYHCHSYWSCGLLYVAMVILGSIASKTFYQDSKLLLGVISIIYLLIVSPVQNDNNILESNDITFYRKIAVRRLVSMLILQIVAYLINFEIIVSVNCMVLFSLALLCFIQDKENRKNEYL